MSRLFDVNEIFVKSEFDLPEIIEKKLTENVLAEQTGMLSAEALAGEIIDRINNFYFIFIFLKLKGYQLSVNPGESGEYDSIPELNEATDVFYELIRRDTACVLCNVSGYRAVLLELAPQPNMASITRTEGFTSYLEDTRQAVIRRCGYPVQLVASERRHGCTELPRCFHGTIFAVDFIFEIYKEKNILRVEVLNDLPPSLSMHAPKKEWEQMYLRALLDYNFRKARVILYDLITDELRNPITALNIRLRMQSRLLWTLSALDMPMNSSSPQCIHIQNALSRIISAKTIGEFYRCIDSIFHDLADFYRKNTVSTAKKLEMIVSDIKENYADPTMSATSLSEKYNMNNAYLSREFKKETGVKLIDFIHHIRVEASKTLLESEQSMEEIAVAVGYYSASTYIRVFKRLEGVSPGTRRKLRR